MANVTRAKANRMILSGTVDPAKFINHENQHVRRTAWRALGKETHETVGESMKLLERLYPNHYKKWYAYTTALSIFTAALQKDEVTAADEPVAPKMPREFLRLYCKAVDAPAAS